MNLAKGMPLDLPAALTLTTDASPWDWGATLENHFAQGFWTAAQGMMTLNWKELAAVFTALLTFAPFLKDTFV